MEKKENLIEVYKHIYPDCFLENGFFDYEKLLIRYGNYLYMFFDKEGSSYGDEEFLKLAIDGFTYFQDRLFGKEELDDGVIATRILEYDSNLREKINIDGKYSQQDYIYTFSMQLPIYFLENNNQEMAFSYGNKAIQNCYRVIETTEEKGCDKNDVEYWKHQN